MQVQNAVMFSGKTLIRADGSEHSADEVLRDAKVVALYFSAHWCPPCRHFTPILAEVYAEVKEALPCTEVVFVSLDHSEEDMLKYMDESHGDWYALKYDDPFRKELTSKYVKGIPTLIVFKMDGTVITSSGREQVQEEGPQAFHKWTDMS
ncbi:nucleoredoxin-like protein 2 isoform X1 [Dermacentor albipictus]|uniref:nucleoredoxin-like protein 2 isoform X1 n=2 Tax=Dermacentor albipictus TaxID=60249 RepID=UPI0038FC5CD5